MSSYWKNIIYGVGIYSLIIIAINILGRIPKSGVYEIIASIIGAAATVLGIFIAQNLQDKSAQKISNRAILGKFHIRSIILKDENHHSLNTPEYMLKFPYEDIFLSFVNAGDDIYNIFYTIKINDVDGWINQINIGEKFDYLTAKSDERLLYLSTKKESEDVIETLIRISVKNIEECKRIRLLTKFQGVHSYAERKEVYHLPISRSQFILVQLIIENMAMRNSAIKIPILKDLFEVNMMFEDKLGNKHEENYLYSLQVKFLHVSSSNPDIECEIRFIPSSIVSR